MLACKDANFSHCYISPLLSPKPPYIGLRILNIRYVASHTTSGHLQVLPDVSAWEYKGQDEVHNQQCNLWEFRQR